MPGDLPQLLRDARSRKRLKSFEVPSRGLEYATDGASIIEPGSVVSPTRALLHTEFAALLSRAGVSQAAFARLAGVTAAR